MWANIYIPGDVMHNWIGIAVGSLEVFNVSLIVFGL